MTNWQLQLTRLLQTYNVPEGELREFLDSFYVGILCKQQGVYEFYFISPKGPHFKEKGTQSFGSDHERALLVQKVVQEYGLDEAAEASFRQQLASFVQRSPRGYMICFSRDGQALINRW